MHTLRRMYSLNTGGVGPSGVRGVSGPLIYRNRNVPFCPLAARASSICLSAASVYVWLIFLTSSKGMPRVFCGRTARALVRM